MRTFLTSGRGRYALLSFVAAGSLVLMGTQCQPSKAPPPPSDCNPNYSPCVPNDPVDVDCAGGGGDGPSFVTGPVQVIGVDVYDLDRDGNGVGCET
jgi:hypothetical protein